MVKNYKEVMFDNETLTTPRLILRKFKKSDAADILEYASDPETLKFLVWEGLKTTDDAIAAIVDSYWARTGVFAIQFEGKVIGCMDIRLEPDHHKASFGYVLNRSYWGRGLMTEALTALLELAFQKLQLNRVESTHYPGNEASGRVMQKCGMVYEGTARQHKLVKGVYQDTIHYAITRDMYKKEAQAL
ncbi:MAG: GNAT family N-acetyltransferase [Defluviitaleaceae bacterium]|nr:GNAT family N-acetyltransferase [Defluviitaleaceae bacterium]